MVVTCDKLLVVKSQIETKEMVTDSIDAIALVGQEISSIRREPSQAVVKTRALNYFFKQRLIIIQTIVR